MQPEMTPITNSPDDVFDLINRLLDVADEGPVEENRISDRRPIAIPVKIQPLDANHQPVGEPFSAITRNISMGGVGLIANQTINTPIAEVTCAGQFCQQPFLIHVRYSNQLEDFYLIGGNFVVDWGPSPLLG